MNKVTFNSTELLFLKVCIDSYDYKIKGRKLSYRKPHSLYEEWFDKDFIKSKSTILGTIQNYNSEVTTSISDEVLKGLVDGKVSEWFNIERIYYNYQRDKWTFDKPLESFISRMVSQGIPLKEGDKYVVLKIKKLGD